MKNVLIVMLALVVFSATIGISIQESGLGYEETLNNFLISVQNGTDSVVRKVKIVGEILSFMPGSYDTLFDDYHNFYVDKWTTSEGETHYLIYGHKTIFTSSRTFLYCTYENVADFKIKWSWKDLYEMLYLYDENGDLILSVRDRQEGKFANDDLLLSYTTTIPALSDFNEKFQDGTIYNNVIVGGS